MNCHPPAFLFISALALGACSSNPLPPPNGIRTSFDRSVNAIEVIVSNAQAPAGAELVSADGTHYPLPLTLISGPHVNYSPPPSIGLGIGGFSGGWGGGFGTGVGIGLPLGGPRATGIDDQYLVSTKVGAPADYLQRWTAYHVEVHVGAQAIIVPAPQPT